MKTKNNNNKNEEVEINNKKSKQQNRDAAKPEKEMIQAQPFGGFFFCLHNIRIHIILY